MHDGSPAQPVVNATTITALLATLAGVDYSNPPESCDVVMKGGITSGIVYPSAIARIAQYFRFRNIGGTSAGALAAALSAAAEHARHSGGFTRFADVPAFLGAGKNMERLFQPSPKTKALFDVALAAIAKRPLIPRILNIVWAAARGYLFTTLICVVLGVVAGAAVGTGSQAPTATAWDVAAAVGIVVAIAALAVLLPIRLLNAIRNDVPDNGYGLCTGSVKGPGYTTPPLTQWLADQIDYVAGVVAKLDDVTEKTTPLLFGDLWGPKQPDVFPGGTPILDTLNERASRAVNLEMVTTDVTDGRPYRLPLSEEDRAKTFFCPDEFRNLYPQRVVDAMVRAAPGPAQRFADGDVTRSILPFPPANELPVIVAARMSMSFPFLFSAIPLYMIATNVTTGKTLTTKRWFSDGGITSNIPIHFFDAPLPRWPTFAINLRNFPQSDQTALAQHEQDESRAVDRAIDAQPDVDEFATSGSGRLMQFIGSLLNGMQNWNDTTQMSLPGYIDRVFEIAMQDDEGGLNLTMPEATLRSIVARGWCAGELINATFAPQASRPSAAWRQQRHTRLRSTLMMQSEWSRRFALAWKPKPDAPPLAPTYHDLIDAKSPDVRAPFTDAQAVKAKLFADQLAAGPETLGAGVTLTDAPYPAPELRARPRI